MNKLIKYSILTLVFILPFFVSVKNFFPMVYTKSLLVEGFVLLVGLLWVLNKIYRKDVNSKIPLNVATISFSAYVLFVLFSTINSVNPSLSFWGTMDHGTGTVYIVSILFLSLVASSVFKTLEDWRNLFTVFVSSGIIYTLCSLMTIVGVKFSDLISITSAGGFTIGNSSWTGMYMSFVLFIALGLFFSTKSKTQKIIGAAGVLTSLLDPTLTGLLPLASGSSFGLIGLARAGSYSVIFATVLFVLYFMFRQIKIEKWKNIFLWSNLVLLVASIVLIFSIGLSPLKQFIFEKAGGNRFVFWEISIDGFKDKPLLGWGGDSYQYVYAKYFDPIILTPGYAPEFWVDRSHNIYFDELVMGGALGLLSLLFMYAVILWGLMSSAIKEKSKDGFLFMAIFAGIISFLVQGLMIFQNSIGWFLISLILAFVASLSFKDLETKDININYKKKKNHNNDLNNLWAFLAVFIFVVTFYFAVIVPYKVNHQLAQFPLMSYTDRLKFYKNLDGQYLGNTIDLGSAMSKYHIRLRHIHKNGLNEDQKKMMLNEIKQLNILIDNSLKKQSYMDVKLLMSVVGINSVAVAISSDNEKKELYDKGLFYIDEMIKISDKNTLSKSTKYLLDSAFEYGEEGLGVLELDAIKK